MCLLTRVHTRTLFGILDVSTGVGLTPGKLGESKSEKAYIQREPRCGTDIWNAGNVQIDYSAAYVYTV